jgi:hypothetical protein
MTHTLRNQSRTVACEICIKQGIVPVWKGPYNALTTHKLRAHNAMNRWNRVHDFETMEKRAEAIQERGSQFEDCYRQAIFVRGLLEPNKAHLLFETSNNNLPSWRVKERLRECVLETWS